MKAIKFRVWSYEGEDMLEWEQLLEASDLIDFLKHPESSNYYSEMMQFTGLVDRNGKGREMYEGDVYKQDKRHYVIEWSERHCGFVARSLSSRQVLPGYLQGEIAVYDDYEYIGSIYEHPHLLKE